MRTTLCCLYEAKMKEKRGASLKFYSGMENVLCG